MNNTHPANLDIVKTKVERWTQKQIKSVDDDVEDHIRQIRESNGSYFLFFLASTEEKQTFIFQVKSRN